MKTFTSMIRQTPARWLLLYGVLAGLFFSGGEGIQLLPFPPAKGKTSKIAARVAEESSKSYAFSVFSSRSSFGLLKAKFQKDSDQYLSGARFAPERLYARPKIVLPAVRNVQESKVLPDFRVSIPQSKRGPPVI
jgi:hypothetical protein